MKQKRPPSKQRSFVIVAVLVIVMSALYVSTALLFMAGAEAGSAASAADAAQLRALGWSGLQAIMTRLADQRDRILAGIEPSLDPQYSIYQTSRVQGVVRLLSWDGQPGLSARRLQAEAGKIDINAADAATLLRSGKIDPAAAAAIIAHREQTLHRPYQSVIELLDVPGRMISPEALLGPVDAIRTLDDSQLQDASVGERIEARLSGGSGGVVHGLADMLTVFSIDPSVQQSGQARINLNVKWSDELGVAIAGRFDQPAADSVKALMKAGVRFDRPSKIVAAMQKQKLPPEQWGVVLDAFTTEAAAERTGLLDINTAPMEALLALPGVSAEQAAQMAAVQRTLSDSDRSNIAWPVTSGIIPPEVFAGFVDGITTRCWTYRVRFAAGEVAVDDEAAPMSSRLVYEAVIDLSGPRPRIAYLRDITIMQQIAEATLSARSDQEPFDAAPQSQPDGAAAPTETTPAAASDAGEAQSSPAEAAETEAPAGDSAAASQAESADGTASPNQAAQATSRRPGRWLPG